jgi:hypothetical protein
MVVYILYFPCCRRYNSLVEIMKGACLRIYRSCVTGVHLESITKVRFEILMALALSVVIVWVVTPCGLVDS